MPERKNVKKVYKNVPERKQRKTWLDDVENYRKKMCVRGWGKTAGKKDAWNLTLKETGVLHGSY